MAAIAVTTGPVVWSPCKCVVVEQIFYDDAAMNEQTEKTTTDLLARMKPGYVINGRYEVERRLGSGGFAVVFVGRDRQIERPVAIKVMSVMGSIDDPKMRDELVERFQREAMLAALVDHPNVINIFDYGLIEGANDPFMVMELLEGHDLEYHLRNNGQMAPKRAIPLFIDALVALGVAHEQGIVHKDLKPSNLFLKRPDSRFEALCILDFGVAHIEQELRSRLTRAGELMGTPAYLSPEYSTERIISPALDSYQMGLLLVETLMGEPVVTHPEPMAAMFQHVRGELEIPLALLECPLGSVIRKALEMDHTRRFENGLEFADALAAVPAGSVPAVTPQSPRIKLSDYLEQGSASQMVKRSGEIAAAEDAAEMASAATMPISEEMLSNSMGPNTGNVEKSPKSTQALYKLPEEEEPPAEISPYEPVDPATGSDELDGETPPARLDDRFQAPTEAMDADFEWEEPRSKWPVVLLLLLLVSAASGGAWVWWSGQDDEEQEELNHHGAATAEEPTPTPTPAEEEAALVGEEEKLIPVEVVVTSDPAGAEVMAGEEAVGTTPFTVNFESFDDESQVLTLRLDGFEDQEVVVSPGDEPDQVAAMVAVEEAAPAAEPTPRPTPRPRPSPRPRPAVVEPTPVAEREPEEDRGAQEEPPQEEEGQVEEDRSPTDRVLLPDF